MASIPHLQLPPLTKQRMAELVSRARQSGVQPEDYAKRLIEDGLALQREAEEKSFAEIMAPVRQTAGDVSDAEVVALMEKARKGHHAGQTKKR
jgi:hypothetical protein